MFERLRHDESVQLDELIERLEAELGSAEIFTALFELELAGRVKQMPGKNYVRAFETLRSGKCVLTRTGGMAGACEVFRVVA